MWKVRIYLKNDGVPFQLAEILKNGIDDLVVLVSLQETGAVLFKRVNKVVEQKICA